MIQWIDDMLIDNREGLTKDSIAAIICLEDEIHRADTAIALIKSRKIIAIYEGDRSEPCDSDKFLLMTENEFEKEKNKDRKDNK